MDFIQKKVSELYKKYNTKNPFELAKLLNITVLYEELGEINGYYNSYVREKMIHINNNLDYKKQLFTCAHELGHAIIHPNSSTPFLRKNTLFSINKLEMEANQFAMDLLINDSEFKELLEDHLWSTYQLSNYFGVDLEIIEYKLKRLYKSRR